MSITKFSLLFIVNSLKDLKYKLTLISLPNRWFVWFPDENNITYALIKMTERNISVYLYVEINSYLSISAYFHGKNIPVSIAANNDILHFESVLQELALEHDPKSKNTKQSFHISRAKQHIKEVINDLLHHNELHSNNSELARV